MAKVLSYSGERHTGCHGKMEPRNNWSALGKCARDKHRVLACRNKVLCALLRFGSKGVGKFRKLQLHRGKAFSPNFPEGSAQEWTAFWSAGKRKNVLCAVLRNRARVWLRRLAESEESLKRPESLQSANSFGLPFKGTSERKNRQRCQKTACI